MPRNALNSLECYPMVDANGTCVPPGQGHCFQSKDELLEADGEVWIQLPAGLNNKVCSLRALQVQQNTNCTVNYHRTYSRRTNGFGSI